MNSHLDFLNKNLYRKYPLRATSTNISTLGLEIPMDLMVGCRISTLYTLRNIYIKQIFVKGDYLSITIVHRDDPTSDSNSPEVTLGSFSGTITQDYQILNLLSFNDTTSGHLVVGKLEAIRLLSGMYLLDYNNGKLEDSLIFCYVRPLVKSITTGSKAITGHIVLSLDNITEELADPIISLEVDDVDKVSSLGDQNSASNNCATPVITKINTVEPDANGNIDIFGISPIQINLASGKLMISTGDLTLEQVCTKATKNIPPVNTSDAYYADIIITTIPEWKTWSQYN